MLVGRLEIFYPEIEDPLTASKHPLVDDHPFDPGVPVPFDNPLNVIRVHESHIRRVCKLAAIVGTYAELVEFLPVRIVPDLDLEVPLNSPEFLFLLHNLRVSRDNLEIRPAWDLDSRTHICKPLVRGIDADPFPFPDRKRAGVQSCARFLGQLQGSVIGLDGNYRPADHPALIVLVLVKKKPGAGHRDRNAAGIRIHRGEQHEFLA